MLMSGNLNDVSLSFDSFSNPSNSLSQIREELYQDPELVMKAISNESMPDIWEPIAKEIGLALQHHDGDKLLKVLGGWAIDYIEDAVESKVTDGNSVSLSS